VCNRVFGEPIEFNVPNSLFYVPVHAGLGVIEASVLKYHISSLNAEDYQVKDRSQMIISIPEI
jgi:hypothetical protein